MKIAYVTEYITNVSITIKELNICIQLTATQVRDLQSNNADLELVVFVHKNFIDIAANFEICFIVPTIVLTNYEDYRFVQIDCKDFNKELLFINLPPIFTLL